MVDLIAAAPLTAEHARGCRQRGRLRAHGGRDSWDAEHAAAGPIREERYDPLAPHC